MKFTAALKQTARDLTTDYLVPFWAWLKVASLVFGLFAAMVGMAIGLKHLVWSFPEVMLTVFIIGIGAFIVSRILLVIIRTFMRNYNRN